MRLAGRRVLITGASSGIGLAAARAFAAEGARVAVLARGRQALEQANLDAVIVEADVADRPAVERAVEEAVAALGGLDVLVSNAAVGAFGHFREVAPEDFDRVVAISFTGAVNVVRVALPHLRASRGTIVATGSLVTRVAIPSWSSYSAAKSALRGFLDALRIEERALGTGVRVAMVHPGVVDTPFWGSATSATGRRARVPPGGYDARVVAEALVASVERPRRDVLLGAGTWLMHKTYAFARPVGEVMLLTADRWFRSGSEPALGPGALWQATERPMISGDDRGGGRPSLLARAQIPRRRRRRS